MVQIYGSQAISKLQLRGLAALDECNEFNIHCIYLNTSPSWFAPIMYGDPTFILLPITTGSMSIPRYGDLLLGYILLPDNTTTTDQVEIDCILRHHSKVIQPYTFRPFKFVHAICNTFIPMKNLYMDEVVLVGYVPVPNYTLYQLFMSFDIPQVHLLWNTLLFPISPTDAMKFDYGHMQLIQSTSNDYKDYEIRPPRLPQPLQEEIIATAWRKFP